ncbi:MAG: hypothetical protein RBT51_11035 [Ectothiorhodospiraceae bacterium]|jgi:hypothetical protein|nr:hypothetical protein [Ectothiorhodospiraceae bacterium]
MSGRGADTKVSGDLLVRVESLRELGEAVCHRLALEVERIGLASEVVIPGFDRAAFSLKRDPATGDGGLVGLWRDTNGRPRGSMVFHGDGSFFAEHDVLRVHPARPGWFVEAVTAWGRDGVIKGESRLIAMPE